MHPYISILTIFLALLMFYHNYSVNRNTVFLSGFIIVFSLYSLIHYVLLISKDVFLLAVFYNNNAPIGFIAGPLIYFYVRGTLCDNVKLTKKDLVHLIPAVINSISITPYVLTPFSYKLALAKRLAVDPMVAKTFTVGLYPNIVNMIARPTLLSFYIVCSIVMLVQFYFKAKRDSSLSQRQTRYILTWLFIFVLIVCIAVVCFGVLSYLFLSNPRTDLARFNNSIPMNIVGFCLLMIPISLLIFPEILYGIPQTRTRVKVNSRTSEVVPENIESEKNNILANENIPAVTYSIKDIRQDEDESENCEIEPRFVELSQSILKHIKESEIFLRLDFSIDDLARSMNVPKHHLYYCFNSILNIKFTKIRTQLRIEYAIKLLESGLLDTMTVEAIGSKSGFSSRSSFQSTFKEEVGCTPVEYFKTRGASTNKD